MEIRDNVIKEYLKNVYFITGTPCGGKSVVSKTLGLKYNIPVYDIDEHFDAHREMSDAGSQPSMNKTFKDADEFFGRTVEEYRRWLLNNTREQLDYVIMDLAVLSRSSPVICDCHLTVEEAGKLTVPERIAFLIKKPDNLVDEYCARPDHRGFSDFIHCASDFEAAKAVCSETLRTLNEPRYTAVKESGYFFLDRKDGRTVEETAGLVAAHFGFI